MEGEILTGSLPPRIIDCHVHVIGDGIVHPYIPNAAYAPHAAPLRDLVALHDEWHVGQAVLIQVSVHGTDNSLMLDALRWGGGRFRGVAVVDHAPSDKLLMQLKESGVVGLRLNLTHGGGPGRRHLERYGAICRDAGFHLQLFPDGRRLPDLEAILRRLNVTLVLDHFGGLPSRVGLSDPAFRSLLNLVRDGTWVKLSGPYRVSSERSGFRDTLPMGREILKLAPERCLWGSDWPHVASDKTIEMGQLVRLALCMTDSPETSDALFFGNAKRLYGF